MVSQEQVEIIIKALDQASDTLKNASETAKKVGDAAQQANQKAISAEQRYQQKISETKERLNETIDIFNDVGNKGAESFKQISESQQESIIKFGMLDEETQTTLQAIRELGIQSTDLIPGADEAIQKLANVDEKIKSWGGSFDYARSKVALMGSSTDSLKGKLQVVGTGIQTYIGNKWDFVKNKVTSTAGLIKSALGSALTTVKSKLDSLGSAFSGLGGIISSAIGGIGMASISEMTIGLSMNRERMSALTNATMGGVEAGDRFLNGLMKVDGKLVPYNDKIKDATVLFKGLDAITNESLVSMDDLGQALSTIKMSTGMTNTELEKMTPVVNDIGQRAILMGKSGDEAIGLMQAAGKGLNGEFEMLKDNFGITKDKLEGLGWDGSAEDVEGYTQALSDALEEGGKLDGMMDTSTGHLETLKKKFKVAGRHIGDMFTPYIDQAVVGLTNLQDSCPGLFEGLVGIAGGISMFATIAPSISPALSAFDNLAGKTKSLLIFTGLLKGEEGALTATTLMNTAAIKLKTLGMEEEAAATAAAEMAEMGFTASLWAATSAILANPITWLVIALIALAAVVYKVGESFGWWSDIPSMLSAIWSGIQRLWNAFINHPDVQAFITGLKKGWTDLMTSLQPVFKWLGGIWNQICPPDAKGKYDIVSSIIHGIGDLWNFLKSIFSAVNGSIQTAQNQFGVFGGFLARFGAPVLFVYELLKKIVCILLGCSPGIVPALEKVQDVFTTVWNAIAGFIGGVISTIVSAIQPIISILSQIANFYLSAFMYAWQTVIMVFNIVSSAINRIISVFNLFLSGQINLQTMIIMIWNTLKSMFVAVFNTIISRVTSFAGKMVTKALAMARQFVSNIVNHVKQLPGKVYSLLLVVVGIIKTAIQAWITAAVSKVTDLISKITSPFSGVAGKITSALSGVASALLSPFKTAWEWIKPYYDKIKGALDILPGGAGGELAAGGMPDEIKPTAPVVSSGSQELTVKGELGFNVNVSGLPAGVDSRQVEDIFNTLVNDKDFKANVMREIATNSVFQKYDRKEKLRLTGKVNRARGV